ncbi:predicted protein [Sclerotinia sclerotiorum 1980 UF-70]|uniref:Uncharacterized protein n=1 Tax=Sclerotinia sclerotiorum (strain ATCC 18683 / 1980 / Ss-1) TaxID=665079 RepID=A7E706_SCLS1|nr:predicted protein [Sclerotinia sclerotiorum 1980 UF-70]EDN96158.1 predicted protein [Sclerotinia sclerotiorum 1980 UF-70]
MFSGPQKLGNAKQKSIGLACHTISPHEALYKLATGSSRTIRAIVKVEKRREATELIRFVESLHTPINLIPISSFTCEKSVHISWLCVMKVVGNVEFELCNSPRWLRKWYDLTRDETISHVLFQFVYLDEMRSDDIAVPQRNSCSTNIRVSSNFSQARRRELN